MVQVIAKAWLNTMLIRGHRNFLIIASAQCLCLSGNRLIWL